MFKGNIATTLWRVLFFKKKAWLNYSYLKNKLFFIKQDYFYRNIYLYKKESI